MKSMFQTNKGRGNVALALMALAVFILACKGLGNQTAEANKLVDKANDEIKAAKKLQADNEVKVTDYKAALNKGDFKGAKAILDGVVNDIDKGVKHGDTAAENLESAAKLKIDDKFKEYLELRAQSVRKRIDSYKELKNMFNVTGNMLANPTASTISDAQPKIKDSQEKIRKLDGEADDLEEKSEKVRKDNPEKFKG
jgi:F0F1-type ATP synthase membrane subunit b/b'